MAASCQNLSKPSIPIRNISSEAYQAQIKLDKKKQAELDLPFRGFGVDKNIETIAFGTAAINCWEAIEKNKPELMILTSSPIKNLSTVPEYRTIRENVPFMCTPNTEAKTEFIKNWPYVKNIIPDNQVGIYHSKIFGVKENQVQVIIIDQLDSEIKWSWLQGELKKTAAIKILTAPTQEREKIFSFLKKSKVRNLILLPHDSPISTFKKIEMNELSTIYEAQSQSRNISSESESENFGLIKISWPNREAQIEIRNINNEKIEMVTLKF